MNSFGDAQVSQSNGDSIRVLILSSEYPPSIIGGLGTHVSELATGLGRAGCQVTLVALTTHKPEVVRDSNVTAHLIPRSSTSDVLAKRNAHVHPGMVEVMSFNADLVKLGLSLFDRNLCDPDLIHCHDWLTYPAADELRRSLNVPVVSTVHVLNYPIFGYWGFNVPEEIVDIERELCRNSDGLITVSESMKGIISATHGVSDDRIDVVHNGLDWRRFAGSGLTADQRKRLRERVAADDEQIIVFAGRLTAQKGVRALLKSAELVIEEHKSVKYLIAGEADSLHSSQMVEEMIRGQRAMSERMKLLGRVERKQLGMIYQVADIAVVPSIYEPFGYAAVEAMAIGVAVIVTGVGGLNEIVEQERSGLKVEVKDEGGGRKEVDVEGLARAQVRLLREEETRKRIGEEGQRRVKEMFNVERMVDRTLLVYRKVITRREAVA